MISSGRSESTAKIQELGYYFCYYYYYYYYYFTIFIDIQSLKTFILFYFYFYFYYFIWNKKTERAFERQLLQNWKNYSSHLCFLRFLSNAAQNLGIDGSKKYPEARKATWMQCYDFFTISLVKVLFVCLFVCLELASPPVQTCLIPPVEW